ncbi:MAG: hypothetical protein mread185_000415 [Mycoplasmataceae bacterium]|nr:MAG: hypothetical protein mread185_000415 [Mycoplasmataceae bacterium]
MKNKKKIWIIRVVSFVILSSVIGGTIFLWNKSKKQNVFQSENEDSTDMGYSMYIPFLPSSGISEDEAKKEVLKALSKYHPSTTPEEVEKILLDVNSKMSKSDREKINKEFDWDFRKSFEEIASKYQKEVFLTLPKKQNKFEEALRQTNYWFFFAGYNIDFPHKENGEIDWIESLKQLSKSRRTKKIRDKIESEKIYKENKEEIELQINAFFYVHAKKFPEISNLAELNQWINIEAQKRHLATSLPEKDI